MELEAHEHANERWFEEAEQLVSFANRLGEIFAKDEPGQIMRVLRVVASDATLEGRKARLNLRPALSLLAKNRSHQNWLTTIRDLRTALDKDPLPLEAVRALLEAV